MTNLFAIFASEDGRQLLSRLNLAIFLFCMEKCPRDAEDAEVGKLCGSAPPHLRILSDALNKGMYMYKFINKLFLKYNLENTDQKIKTII